MSPNLAKFTETQLEDQILKDSNEGKKAKMHKDIRKIVRRKKRKKRKWTNI